MSTQLEGEASQCLAARLFVVPPFPGSRPHTMIQVAPSRRSTEDEAARLIAAIRKHRTVGSFWTGTDPWATFTKEEVFDGDSDLALIAAIAGCRTNIAALSPIPPTSEEHEATLQALVGRHLIDGTSWRDPFTGSEGDPAAIVEVLAFWRRQIDANRAIAAAYGFASWKQDTVSALLWPGDRPTVFARASIAHLNSLSRNAPVAVWKARVPDAFLSSLEISRRPIIEVEDGFIRSIGLGADCVPPLSIALDGLGAHYDPARPSDLENLIAQTEFTDRDIHRARTLRSVVTRKGISKYDRGGGVTVPRPAGDRRHVLVTGQVEDDRSVRLGGCGISSNLDLLRRVRSVRPDAYILYRPHPDVASGHRTGGVANDRALELADEIDHGRSISALISMVDEVHVLTSLAGFEALLAGKTVVTYGVPFYAGWGLTTDLAPVPERRHRSVTIDELVAAVLLIYPRYLDPITGLPCTAELLVERIGAGVRRENSALVALRKGWGVLRKRLAPAR